MRKFKKTICIAMIGAMALGCISGCTGSGEISEIDVTATEDNTKTDIENGKKADVSEETNTGDNAKKESIAAKYRKKQEEYEAQTVDQWEDTCNASEECADSAVMEESASAVTNDAVIESNGSAAYVGGSEIVDGDYSGYYGEYDAREFDSQEEHSFVSTYDEPLSTFAADRDTASYSIVRSYIETGSLPDTGAVRLEEMINYFDYEYASQPNDGEKFAVYTEYADCPWNSETKLLMVGVNTEAIDFDERKPMNLVFLIDTSGSMFDDNKLPLAQKAFMLLAGNLNKDDRVSIVTYAGSDTLVLSGAAGDETYTITEALDGLTAYGCTNGGDGIISAYEIAEKYFIEDGNNRVILATDGDLNVGLTSESDLTDLITEEKESGIFLSVLGFGTDNLKDNKLEALADKGNGNYAYIDSIYEAQKVLVDEMGGTLETVAKDVKFQIEFNPANVKGYRQIGYENRALAADDFDDDTVDGGEIGAGHMVTALYEIVPADSDFEVAQTETKYSDRTDEATYTDELATVKLRYKEPDADTSELMTRTVKTDSYKTDMSADLKLASAVAAYGMFIADSKYYGNTTFGLIEELANAAYEDRKDSYAAENIEQFIDMTEQTEKLCIIECN